ncbi:hypothetical protein J2772_003976 [Chryseobacterium jejuense]|nr:hypothetical protein [Chryseobacterium jejuense]
MADIRTTSIEADCFCHIYNRGINRENIFENVIIVNIAGLRYEINILIIKLVIFVIK